MENELSPTENDPTSDSSSDAREDLVTRVARELGVSKGDVWEHVNGGRLRVNYNTGDGYTENLTITLGKDK